MLIYIDMCCLKRPFDNQAQPRIRLESEAVLGLLAAENAELRFVRSPALILENLRNPIKERALRVGKWLAGQPATNADAVALERRTEELMLQGLKNFDALHVASAEQAAADAFASCDDRLLAAAARNRDQIKVRVIGIVELARGDSEMSDVLIQPVELRARGFDALVRALGWVNAVRFIQEYEPSRHNYTAERDSILPDWDAAEMVRQINQVQPNK